MIETLNIITIFAAAEEPAKKAGGIGALGLDPWAILAQATTFLLLFWIIRRFALEKIVATLEERRKTIDKGVRLGIEMQAEKDELDFKVEAEFARARLETDRIIAEAQAEADALVKKAEIDARKNVNSILSDANDRIKDDVQKAKLELKKEMVGLVAEATEIILEEKLDAKKDDALLTRALSGVSNE